MRGHDHTSQNTICRRATPDQNGASVGTSCNTNSRGGTSNSSRMPLSVRRTQRYGNQLTPNVHTLSLLGRMCSARGLLNAGPVLLTLSKPSFSYRTPSSTAPMPPSNNGLRGLLKSSLSSPVNSQVLLTYHPVVSMSDRSI